MNQQDVILAATACRDLIEHTQVPHTNADFGKDHLLEMVSKIESGEISGEKSHRWLGYLQGVIVSNSGATLEQMKRLNKPEK